MFGAGNKYSGLQYGPHSIWHKFVRVVITFSHISNAQSGDEITRFGLVL